MGLIRRGMLTRSACELRAFVTVSPRKRLVCLTGGVTVACSLFILITYGARLSREELMARQIGDMHIQYQFLQSLYRARKEELLTLQLKSMQGMNTSLKAKTDAPSVANDPEIAALLKNMSGTRAALGLEPKFLQPLTGPFIYQLMPHLMEDVMSLRPAYHMKGNREHMHVVMGVPTVKRDKENYLMTTLKYLVRGLQKNELSSTLIIVMVGETDLEFVLNTAWEIETAFPEHVASGMIEVLSPSASYYPNLDAIPRTLGDSQKRVKWRTKQNLDIIFLMAYAQTKGLFYLMLEDDIIAKKNYLMTIKDFASSATVTNPTWFFIEFCYFGGIGKLFRSSDLVHFVTYVQLFYNNMPIDWLLESYLADRVCNINKQSNQCSKNKTSVRPQFKFTLFKHIGLFSSLKGKIQKVMVSRIRNIAFYPHNNPPLATLRTDVEERKGHSLKGAYEGVAYFRGVKPKQGNLIEFWFLRPTQIERYTFRTGNVEHRGDRLFDAVVEALPATSLSNYTVLGTFDEFGLADGPVPKDIGALAAVRLRVTEDSPNWLVISEIELKPVADGVS